jgi:hypothetical protein
MFLQIHEIVYYGGGGYDWNTIYDMPIWLRNFTHKQIADAIASKNEAAENASIQNSRQPNTTVINTGDIKDKAKMPAEYRADSSYIAKMSKKK